MGVQCLRAVKVVIELPITRFTMITFLVMVTEAIEMLKDRTGSSRQAITRYILNTHDIDASKVTHIKTALKKGVEKGVIKKARTNGKGAGCFKVAKETKSIKEKSNKKMGTQKTLEPVLKTAEKKPFRKPVKKLVQKSVKTSLKKIAEKKPFKKAEATKKAAKTSNKTMVKKTPEKKFAKNQVSRHIVKQPAAKNSNRR